MKRIMIVAAVIFTVAGTSYAVSNGPNWFSELLNGLQEAPAIVSTTGTGTFRAEINRDETEIHYVLTFNDLQSDVRQAHIHIGHPQNAGNIVLWLCDSATNQSPVATTPECGANNPGDLKNGSAEGTLTAADVIPLGANGIAVGEFGEVIALIRAGKTYVNVHTASIPAGEIRSQIDHQGDGHSH